MRAPIRQADARAEAALAEYEQRVLIALEETETALVNFGRQQFRRDFLRESAQASEKATSLARLRYQYGVSDFLTVLDAERTLLQARISSRRAKQPLQPLWSPFTKLLAAAGNARRASRRS